MGVDPSGVPVEVLTKLVNGVKNSRHQPIARIKSKHGDIFISEAWTPEENGFEVMWVCRRWAQKVICSRWSSQVDRINAVKQEAIKLMSDPNIGTEQI